MHHMHYDKSLFTNYHNLKYRLYVGGIASGLKAVGVGDVKITDSNSKTRVLNGVLHVPDLKCGLMSLNTLALVGLNTTITKEGCVISDGDFRIHSPIRNGLCVWGEGTINGDANALFASLAPKKVSLTDWHERLGHTSKNTLLKFGNDAIEDLNLDPAECDNDEDHDTPCESCVTGKHARAPFKPRTERRKNALELVHSDLAEANVVSISGGKYVLTFKDDADKSRDRLHPRKQERVDRPQSLQGISSLGRVPKWVQNQGNPCGSRKGIHGCDARVRQISGH